MNEHALCAQEGEGADLASVDVAEVDDHLGPDILSDATQLDFNDIVQDPAP